MGSMPALEARGRPELNWKTIKTRYEALVRLTVLLRVLVVIID